MLLFTPLLKLAARQGATTSASDAYSPILPTGALQMGCMRYVHTNGVNNNDEGGGVWTLSHVFMQRLWYTVYTVFW